MIKGQTGKDSILFCGNIVYDGDACEATFMYELYIKHNPKQQVPIVFDSEFSIKCALGDTLVLKHIETGYPYFYQMVEFIANDTLPQNIFGDTQSLVMIGIIIRNIKQQTCLLKTQSESPKW